MRVKYLINKKRFWTAMAVGPIIGPFAMMLAFMVLFSFEEGDLNDYAYNPVPLLFIMGVGLLFSLPYMIFLGAPLLYFVEKFRPPIYRAAFLYIFCASVIPFVSGSIFLNMQGPGALFGVAGLVSGIAISIIMLKSRADWPHV